MVGTVNLTTFPTVQQVVDYINSFPGFSAAVLNGSGPQLALNGLDYVTTQDIKTAVPDMSRISLRNLRIERSAARLAGNAAAEFCR